MTEIKLPSIPVPAGCEAEAALLFSGLKDLFRFTAIPAVVPDAGFRSVTASLESSLNSAAEQALAAAAKRKTGGS